MKRFRWLLLASALVVVGVVITAAFLQQDAPSHGEAAVALPEGVTVRQVDGGPDYYGRFRNGLPAQNTFFPIGVWLESVMEPTDVAKDKAVGINTYVDLFAGSSFGLVREAGSFAISSLASPDSSGFDLSDESDMWAGPGTSRWTGLYPGMGDLCQPEGSKCGFTVQAQRAEAANPDVMTYANYGKGVTFWESDDEAGRFVNDFQDLVSADNYWFTDPNICGPSEGGKIVGGQRSLSQEECRRAANYGWTVDRLRNLQKPGQRIPVWGFVEDGHPSKEDQLAITGPQLRAAVWSSIIHGARGIIYFNHNFGGDCISYHVLRDSCGDSIRPTVSSVNHQIQALAPVLNSPFLDGALSNDGSVDTAVKAYNGELYIIAGAKLPTSHNVEFKLSCGAGSSLSVIGENRSIPIMGGKFTDTFADGNAVHIYRVLGGNACGITSR